MSIPGETFSELSSQNGNYEDTSLKKQLPNLSKRHISSKTRVLSSEHAAPQFNYHIGTLNFLHLAHFTLGIHNCNLTLQNRASVSLKIRYHLTLTLGENYQQQQKNYHSKQHPAPDLESEDWGPKLASASSVSVSTQQGKPMVRIVEFLVFFQVLKTHECSLGKIFWNNKYQCQIMQ